MFILVLSCVVYVCHFVLQQLTIDTVAAHVYKAIDALPVTAHPMTQFTTGVMALQVSLPMSSMLFPSLRKSCGNNTLSLIYLQLYFLNCCKQYLN